MVSVSNSALLKPLEVNLVQKWHICAVNENLDYSWIILWYFITDMFYGSFIAFNLEY